MPCKYHEAEAGEECHGIKLHGQSLKAFRKFCYINNTIEARGSVDESVSATTKKGIERLRLGEL